MTAIVGIVTSGLLLIMIVFALTGYAYKRRKMCFKEPNTGVQVNEKRKKKSSKKVKYGSIHTQCIGIK
jgi:hypothetical protein